ncbi:Mitochondrial ribosomal protein S5 isoform 2 [Danaus plexippus plexippus]|uniref:Mitochondrial ribosomal protein S5 isoform 2 n=1 Tax=Danaus plexippus plexippus TaxID=278856 RepID=A0A212ER94_DANPL|nr:Mitochondrial ribosomal protein S5 isoform 2 [Danaus plexippus plexippus]
MATKLLMIKNFLNKPLSLFMNSPHYIKPTYNLQTFSTTPIASVNFFNKLPAEKLWKSEQAFIENVIHCSEYENTYSNKIFSLRGVG